jgi:hypothetical protein
MSRFCCVSLRMWTPVGSTCVSLTLVACFCARLNSVNLRGHPLLTRDVFALMLDYLYRGECDLSIENAGTLASLALRLSVAAEQLLLHRLALQACNYLRSVTTLENCASLLRLADELKSLNNKAFLLNFIHKHQKEVMKHKSNADLLGLTLFQEVVAMAFNECEGGWVCVCVFVCVHMHKYIYICVCVCVCVCMCVCDYLLGRCCRLASPSSSVPPYLRIFFL